MTIRQQSVLITGCSTGIGRAVALELHLKETIIARTEESQVNPTSVDVFSYELADKILGRKPPALIRTGKKSTLLPFMKRWIPGLLLDKILERKFKLNMLSS